MIKNMKGHNAVALILDRDELYTVAVALLSLLQSGTLDDHPVSLDAAIRTSRQLEAINLDQFEDGRLS